MEEQRCKYCFFVSVEVPALADSGEEITTRTVLRFHADGFRVPNSGALYLYVESALGGVKRIATVFAPGQWFRVDITREN